MDDPVVGGYTPEKVALRRAIALGYDVAAGDPPVRAAARRSRRSRSWRRWWPATTRPAQRDERLRPGARAKALLDMYGYVDRDGDGWRERPDGRPLVLRDATPARPALRASSTSCGRRTWTRSASASCSGARKWPEQLKAGARRQAADVGRGPASRRARRRDLLSAGLRPAARARATGRASTCRRIDALYEQPARAARRPRAQAADREAQALLSPTCRTRSHVHRICTDLTQPWVHRLPPHRCSCATAGSTSTSTPDDACAE